MRDETKDKTREVAEAVIGLVLGITCLAVTTGLFILVIKWLFT